MGLKLDLGCGSYCRGDVGIDIDFSWSNPYHRPHFYDKVAGSKNPYPDLVLADANYPLPFRSNAFDEVVMIHVIEHLVRPYDCLREIYRVLKPGGKLILVTPNAQKSPADWRDEGHIISFTEPALKRLLSLVFDSVNVRVAEEQPFCGEDLHAVATKRR